MNGSSLLCCGYCTSYRSSRTNIKVDSFDTGPEGPKLKGYQGADQTMKLMRYACSSGHGCGDSGPKWHAPPCFEGAA